MDFKDDTPAMEVSLKHIHERLDRIDAKLENIFKIIKRDMGKNEEETMSIAMAVAADKATVEAKAKTLPGFVDFRIDGYDPNDLIASVWVRPDTLIESRMLMPKTCGCIKVKVFNYPYL